MSQGWVRGGHEATFKRSLSHLGGKRLVYDRSDGSQWVLFKRAVWMQRGHRVQSIKGGRLEAVFGKEVETVQGGMTKGSEMPLVSGEQSLTGETHDCSTGAKGGEVTDAERTVVDGVAKSEVE